MRALPPRVLAAMAVFLCGSCTGDRLPPEGQEPGTCNDGADNDQDGYFDCDDNGCWGSPVCDGEADTDTDTDADADADADADTDTDTDTDTGTAIVPDYLVTMTLEYTVSFDIDDTWEPTMCGQYGVCDCSMSYEGGGSQVSAHPGRVTLFGSWVRTASDCGTAFEDALWVDESEQAYHTFVFDNGITELDDWIAHANQVEWEPEDSPLENEQFYIIHMSAPWDGGSQTIHHEELETQYLDDIVPYFVNSDVYFFFNE